MPAVVLGAAVSAGIATAFTVFGGGTLIAGSVLATFGARFAAGLVGSALLGALNKQDTPDANLAGAINRQQMIRSAVVPHQIIYGEARVSGPIVFAHRQGANYLHLVIVLAGHEVDAITTIWFNNRRIEVDARDGNGYVIDGFYAQDATTFYARLIEHLGAADQTASTVLVNGSNGKWTADHRLRGRAYLHAVLARLAPDGNDLKDKYPSGAPNISALVRGRQVYDPRDAGTRWTRNPALAVRDYLTASFGLGADSTEIDDDTVTAAANVCDERVSVTGRTVGFTASASTDYLTLAEEDEILGHGDGVRLTTTGTLPTGLSAGTTYYVIRRAPQKLQLAATYDDALAHNAIDITGAGSGTHTITHYDQARYTLDMGFDLSANPRQVLEALLSAMAGSAVLQEGKWRIYAGAYTAPSVSIGEADIIGPVEWNARTSRRDLFNTVRGVYVARGKEYQTTDFAEVSNATYVTQDGGDKLYRDIKLPGTDNPVRAQRIAKIHLEQARQQITCVVRTKLTAFSLAPWDTVSVTIGELGWSAKVFRVLDWGFGAEGVVLLLREEASTAYDWAAGEETLEDPAPDTTLPDPFEVAAPSNLQLASGTEHLLASSDGGIVSRVLATWDAAEDFFADGYDVQYRRSTVATWTDAPRTELTRAYIAPVEDGSTYYVRVRTRNTIGQVSDWHTSDPHVVVGKSANPSTPASFTVARLADGTRRFDWSLVTDADVRAGGGYRIRYHASETAWDNMTALHDGVLTASPFETIDPVAGTWNFALRAVDSSDNESDSILATSVVLGDPRLGNVIYQQDEAAAGWPGTKTNLWHYTRANTLRAIAATGGKIADLPAAITSLAASFNTPISTRESSGSYETAEIDLGADIDFTPVVSWTGSGSATIEMKTGTTADGSVVGSYVALAAVKGKRYVQIRISLSGTTNRLEALTTLVSAETATDEFEDVNTATETATWFASTAAGHFKVGSKSGKLASITKAQITAIQNVGAGWTWELISKSQVVNSQPAAEFKVYNSSSTLADAVVDVSLTGPKAT